MITKYTKPPTFSCHSGRIKFTFGSQHTHNAGKWSAAGVEMWKSPAGPRHQHQLIAGYLLNCISAAIGGAREKFGILIGAGYIYGD